MNDDQATSTPQKTETNEAAGYAVHQGFQPLEQPIRPKRPAPARFGIAGISGGERWRIKSTVTLPRGPLYQKRVLPDGGRVSDVDELGHRIATSMGWFSIGLGVAEVVAANQIARWLGMPSASAVLRACGVREIGSGIGLLASERDRPRGTWMWTRVVGDGIDLATLAPALSQHNDKRSNVMGALAAVLGATVLDVIAARRLTSRNGNSGKRLTNRRRSGRRVHSPEPHRQSGGGVTA